MDNTWSKILVFCVLSLVLGFILGRTTVRVHHGHERGAHACPPENAHKGVWIDKDQEKVIELSDDGVTTIIKDMKDSDFEGDTTIVAGGASININKDGGEIRVKVEMEDDDGNSKRVEKKIMIIDGDDD